MTKNKQAERNEAPPQNSTLEVQKRNEAPPQNSTLEVQERDEFCDPQYLDPDAKLPRIQALRGNTPKLCGYFVAVDQMAIAGWEKGSRARS